MGFVEFQQLSSAHKAVSSRLLRVELDFEARELADASDEAAAGGLGSELSTEGHFARDDAGGAAGAPAGAVARWRWREGARKARLLVRVVDALPRPRGRAARWLEAVLRGGLYAGVGRVMNAPFEVLALRAVLGLPAAGGGSRWAPRALATGAGSAVVALFLSALVAHAAESIDAALSGKGRARKGLIGLALSSLVCYPLDLAFAREVVLGQSPLASARAFGLASYRGVETVALLACTEALTSWVHGSVLRARSWWFGSSSSSSSSPATRPTAPDDEPLWAPVLQICLAVGTMVPVMGIYASVATSGPSTLHPAAAAVAGSASLLAAQQLWREGTLWRGTAQMFAAMPFTFAIYFASQTLVRRVLGPTRQERLAATVEACREELELRQCQEIVARDLEHLDSLVRVAWRLQRVPLLLLVNDSADGLALKAVAPKLAQQLPHATVVVGSVEEIPRLHDLVRDTRLPFVLPIVAEARLPAILFSREDPERCLLGAALAVKHVQQLRRGAGEQSQPQQSQPQEQPQQQQQHRPRGSGSRGSGSTLLPRAATWHETH
jgi:hypothetical protein